MHRSTMKKFKVIELLKEKVLLFNSFLKPLVTVSKCCCVVYLLTVIGYYKNHILMFEY